MSFSVKKNNKKIKPKQKRSKTQPKKNEKLSAIELLKKLYNKHYSYPSNSLLDQIDNKYLKLFFDDVHMKDVAIISKLLSEFFFLQSIQISPYDPEKPEEPPKRIYKPIWLVEEEKNKKLKEKKIQKEKSKAMFNKIISNLAKHISQSKEIISLSLNSIELSKKHCQILSKSILNNNSLQNLSITNSGLNLYSYEILLESILNKKYLTFLDLSNNNFTDKYGYMISRIILVHSQRRDQIVWLYNLRNELPPSNDYKKGLMFINLNGNNLSKDSAEYISNVLYSDQYIRAIYLNNNKFDNSCCKKFIYMMRKNMAILTIDLRNNPGYDEDIHHRLVLKMSKNIRNLFQQYKRKEYTEDEFEQLKEFIDISFFEVNIPENIVEFYNNNLPQKTFSNNLKDKNEDNINKEFKKYIRTEEGGNKINLIKNKILNSDENNINNNIIKNKNDNNNKNMNNNYMNLNLNTNILEENKKLFAENIKLKKQIIELKAKKLNLDKNLNINNINTNNSKKNQEIKNESILQEDYNKVELLINELNDLMNKIEEKKTKIQDNKKNKNNNKNKINAQKDFNNIKNIQKDNNIKEEEKNYSKENNNNKNNNNKYIEEEDDDHFVDDEGNVHNIDDLTDEEKMIILQQQLILQKMQEEAEARGEQFDPQEYIDFLESQVKEAEEEEELKKKKR